MSCTARATCGFFLLILLGGSLFGQSRLLTLRDPLKQRRAEPFGGFLAVLGDLDGDGIREILAGSPYESQKGAVYLFSGRTGRLLFQQGGAAVQHFFGVAVANAGDVDADGVPDFLVGDNRDDRNGSASGSVFVYSGRDGALIRVLSGTVWSFFGSAAAAAGDVDGDGHADFMVSAPHDDTAGANAGSVRVFSGADGSVLFTFFGASPGVQLGSVASAGDVNADGIPDFLIGEGSGSVARVFSGRDGSLLLALSNPLPSIIYFEPTWVAGLGDLDGDGFDDLGLGSDLASFQGVPTGAVLVFSGRTGNLLYDLAGDGRDDCFSRIAPMPDVTGDGIADFLVGAPRTDRIGYVRGFSGADGSTLFTVHGSGEAYDFGVSTAAFDDLDGDGAPEFLVGAWSDFGAGRGRMGTVKAFSMTTLVDVQPPVPGSPGAVNTLTATAPGPGRTLLFFAGRFPGYTPLAGCPSGRVVGIDEPKLLGTAVTDPSGTATLQLFVPGRFAHRTLWFQALDSSNCAQSQVVSRTFL